ncbi:MAG TPA: CapA family protein [Bryobacteraceae bacterium]|jgi:poly-gamma-glutamate synthesis protein (capsule biosynthesis protein)
MKPIFRSLLVLLLASAAGAQSGDGPWPWSGAYGDHTVTLLLTGDINVQKRADPAGVFVHVRDTLRRAGLVYGNLEGLLVKTEGPDKDIPDKSGWQHVGPEAVNALLAGNIPVVGVANNVAYGPANIMKSLAVLDKHGILHTGGGDNLEQAHKPAIIERKGVRLGFLQYTAKWYMEDQQIATPTMPGVARILSKDGMSIDAGDLDRLREDIRRLRPLVDIVVVSSHNRDGLTSANVAAERTSGRAPDLFSPIPLGPRFSQAEAYEKELAHAAIDAGADVVYGHGSHVLQGVEVYRGKPVLYCVGNFAMDWIRMRPNREGAVIRVVAEGHHVLRVSFVPSTRDEENNVRLLDPSSGEGARMLQKVKDLSPGVPLKTEGKEVVLIDNQVGQASGLPAH